MESTLSKIPPWPGINLPVSLTPNRRLHQDSNKSPICPTIEIEIHPKIAKRHTR